MPFALATLKPVMWTALTSTVPVYQPNSNAFRLYQSYIDAILESMDTTLKTVQIVGGVVAGGVAPPGGPVAGATLTAAAPVFTVTSVADVYKPPSMSVTMPDGSSKSGSFTPLQKAQLEVVDMVLKAAVTEWLTLWVAAALPVVVGGVAAWIPPTGVTPPAPGPWAGGTVVPFLFDGPGGGVSPGVLAKIVDKTGEAAGRAKTANVHIWADEYQTMRVIGSDISKATMLGILAAFTALLDGLRLATLVIDKSGSGGSGVAAPGGVVTGVMGPLTLDLV